MSRNNTKRGDAVSGWVLIIKEQIRSRFPFPEGKGPGDRSFAPSTTSVGTPKKLSITLLNPFCQSACPATGGRDEGSNEEFMMRTNFHIMGF